MRLTGLHLLLTYKCNFQCAHCFVWGSPWQVGTMTLANVDHILEQAEELGTITSIYFEGGEVFIYHGLLLASVREAVGRGFEVGIVSNAYWATSEEDAIAWLRPLAGLVNDLTISDDAYHGNDRPRVANATAAARRLQIPIGTISVAQPETAGARTTVGHLPAGESAIMYRGRAAAELATHASQQPWSSFTSCPYEDLREPGRVHVDPLGNVHLCQGISLGNLFATPLPEIVGGYRPDAHPIAGPLLAGGPAGLARSYDVPCDATYADACHLCYETRSALRRRFPAILAPDQMYGVTDLPR